MMVIHSTNHYSISIRREGDDEDDGAEGVVSDGVVVVGGGGKDGKGAVRARNYGFFFNSN